MGWARAVLAAPALIGLWGCPYESSGPVEAEIEAIEARRVRAMLQRDTTST